MAKYRFPLEAVERVRKIAEEQALQEMASYQQKFQQAIQHKKDLLSNREAQLSRRENLSLESVKPADYALVESHIRGIEQQLIKADQAIVRARRFLEQAMRAYIKARKEKSMMDKLRERSLAQWKVEQARLEQKQIDDMVSTRFAVQIDKEELT
jgi:flagellar protein FliJ